MFTYSNAYVEMYLVAFFFLFYLVLVVSQLAISLICQILYYIRCNERGKNRFAFSAI